MAAAALLRRTSSRLARSSKAACPFPRSMVSCAVSKAQAGPEHVDFTFSDGSSFRFHALWLRDACRDPTYFRGDERVLWKSAAVAAIPENLSAREVTVEEGGKVRISWADEVSEDSRYEASFLRSFADVAARPLTACEKSAPAALDWLRPYSGYPGVRAPARDSLRIWTATEGMEDFQRFSRASLEDAGTNLEMLRTLMRDGMVIVEDLPQCSDASAMHHLLDNHVGSMQKDPSRAEPNWWNSQKDNAQSMSYNPKVRLLNHTDQTIPSHGATALLLTIAYVEGTGVNTIVDGYNCAEKLRAMDPEAFHLLSTYHCDAGRDVISSRVDAVTQTHTNGLLLSAKYPVLLLDEDGAVQRCRYSEVSRTPSALPYDVFPKWFAALRKWVQVLHDPANERSVEMRAGQVMLINNWRLLHGRAAPELQSPDRLIVGGTTTRENFYSKACELLQRTSGIRPFQVHVGHS